MVFGLLNILNIFDQTFLVFPKYFKRECCILKRHEAHPNIQKCLGVVNQFGRSLLPGLVSKDVAVGYLKAFVFEDERATNRTKVQLVSWIQTKSQMFFT